LTTDTRVRTYSLQLQYETPGSNTGNFVQAANRRGRTYCGATIVAHEIELRPSTGTGTVNGQPVTKHRMVVHLTRLEGFVVLDKTSSRFITTGQATDDTGYDLAQYVNADGSASGEFVTDGFGFWSYSQPTLKMSGAKPIRVTVNNLLAAPYDANGNVSLAPWNVLDLGGVFVKTDSFPPGYTQSGNKSWNVILMASADLLLTPIIWFKQGGARTTSGRRGSR
jgi:hypothetical protein